MYDMLPLCGLVGTGEFFFIVGLPHDPLTVARSITPPLLPPLTRHGLCT